MLYDALPVPGTGERGAGGAVSEAARSGCSWKCRRQDPSLEGSMDGYGGCRMPRVNGRVEQVEDVGRAAACCKDLVSSPGQTSACMVTPT